MPLPVGPPGVHEGHLVRRPVMGMDPVVQELYVQGPLQVLVDGDFDVLEVHDHERLFLIVRLHHSHH